jgi:hypothetical protein
MILGIAMTGNVNPHNEMDSTPSSDATLIAKRICPANIPKMAAENACDASVTNSWMPSSRSKEQAIGNPLIL